MKIYTRKGDEGFTSLLAGLRARKDDPRIDTVGTLDELNSHLGWARVAATASESSFVLECIEPIAPELFVVGMRVASMGSAKDPHELPIDCIERMERQIDAVWQDLPPLHNFVLPLGCELACRLHITRTVARRAERTLVHLLNPTAENFLFDPEAMKYVNRLSDLLFALARLANHQAGEEEAVWKGS